ncbi:formate dehydrogenase accessory protein FdhE [Thauera linaloolentis]|uniref:Protein FdhE homolog n=1 Tax=Thauera linaloolentis (strain DSM 12138 / JCM 21573 / CCUG 41526 / CIP 105981 / IAM 15112 / NBRC 102519 / 47Lol) TaxID=1123367 RepID=N6YVM4_THAL4|nr:formate dehydrogenase accessory protein FdhE [Thauera linaloolentis]ENO86452.1 formate dehydrogenase accessory protein [Thauera linaloolentis 47Lol = DSM 12138]MCM8567333.1 formate dehydrogenase accessory protein FdhE [Thauera linaloolentis]
MNLPQAAAAGAALQQGLEAPAVLPPAPASVFADRAARFERLADGHASGDWLAFLARLTRTQHALLQNHPPADLPSGTARALALSHGMPALPANGWRRNPVWRRHLAALAEGLQTQAPEVLRPVLAGLPAIGEAELERLADGVLRTEYDPAHSARLPFVAAALQVYWTWMAAQPALAGLARLDVPGVCPCCGSLPVASVIQAGQYAGVRYLHCSLCNTEWNLVRANCTSCGETDKVSYRVLEGAGGGAPNGIVRAEVCDHCHGYLKQMRRDKDASADPVADDLATLALDILVDEAGYLRGGPNPLFIPGSAGEHRPGP